MLAKASGADVMITDIVDSALDLAKELGADIVVNPHRDDPAKIAQEWTDGRGADIVFECAGGPSMPQTLPQATRMVRRGGKVVIVGGFDEGEVSIPLEWQRIQMSEIQLIPSASFSYRDIYTEQGEVVELIAKGKLPVSKLITHKFKLEEINEAFDVANEKERTGAVFVAITWISGPNEKGCRSGRPYRFRWCRRSAFDVFGEYGEAAGAHFGEAAAHVDALELEAGGAVDLHRAVADGRHERGVALEHAELTLRARDDHHVDVLGTDQAGRRDEFEVEGHRLRLPRPASWPSRPLPRCRRPCRTRLPEGGRTRRRRPP